VLTATKVPTSGTLLPTPLPSFDLGGSGQPLHFLHANGYPPDCYKPLLEKLAARYHVVGMLLRPLWPGANPNGISDWKVFSDDLRRFLVSQGAAPVIGMGHSIGAIVTLRAALQDPGLFRALVLIDPVLLPIQVILRLRVMHALRLTRLMSARADAALRRRRRFDNLDKMFVGYRRREIFRFFSDENLRALIGGLTRPTTNGGYKLVYSPEWEARIYQTGIWKDLDLWPSLGKLRVPTLIIRGAETDTFWESTGQMVQQRNPHIQILTVRKATHLVPMERPAEVASAAQQFLDSMLADQP
jgi:pimeloyl-ACP methyl ester carboxylesterase